MEFMAYIFELRLLHTNPQNKRDLSTQLETCRGENVLSVVRFLLKKKR